MLHTLIVFDFSFIPCWGRILRSQSTQSHQDDLFTAAKRAKYRVATFPRCEILASVEAFWAVDDIDSKAHRCEVEAWWLEVPPAYIFDSG